MEKNIEAPPFLKELQEWFGGVITQPIDLESRISPISPSGKPIQEEASYYILPSKTLSAKDRIEIYNQQYWWRLLSILHENFPLVTSLFGYFDFNQTMGFPYLQKYPPTHWSLNTLGDTLPEWILEFYHEEDKELVYDSTCLDLAYNLSFTAGELKPIVIVKGKEAECLTKKVFIQPHLFLLELRYDLIPFRTSVLKHSPDYFADHDFPPLKKEKKEIAIFRNQGMHITTKAISSAEREALSQFKGGNTVEQFCDWLQNKKGRLFQEVEKNLIHWFQEWVALGWLGEA